MTSKKCDHNPIQKNGEIVCKECGEILDKVYVDFSFDFKENNGVKPNSGFRTKFIKNDVHALTQENTKITFERLSNRTKWFKDYYSKQFSDYLYFYGQFQSYFPNRIPNVVESDLEIVHKKLADAHVFDGRKLEVVLTAMFYFVSVRIHGLPFLMDDFKHPDWNHDEFTSNMSKGLNIIKKTLNVQLQKIDYKRVIVGIGKKLQFSSPRIYYASLIFDFLKKRITTRKSHLGCALYIAGKTVVNGEIDFRSFGNIAKALSCTELTLRNRYKIDVRKYWGHLEYTDERFGRNLFKQVSFSE